MDLERALDRQPTGERPRFDRERNCLVGSRCPDCSAPAWPGRAVCHRCGGSDVQDVPFARTATLLTVTEVHVPRPGVEVPYMLGQAALDDGGPLLFGRVCGLSEPVSLPCPVDLVVGETDEGRSTYWFERAD